MWINSIKVTGEYHLSYEFNKINVLLGENGTGKSTFTKLILYALGVDIPDFIEEIVKYRFCDWVNLDFKTKSGNRYKVVRKLPYADMIMITPFENNTLNEEEVKVYNLEEYSDFLLEEEQYSKEQVAYGNNQHATFRYRFMLRTAVVDQSTPHSKILANLGGSGSEYISNQVLVNKAIIEEVLKRNNSDEQRIRLELKSKEKQRAEVRTKLNFYKEIADEYKDAEEKYPIQLNSLNLEMEKLMKEKDGLSTQKYNALIKLEHTSDKNTEKKIVDLRTELNKLKESQTSAKLEILDVDEVLKKLKDELEELKINIASKKILQNIPVTICPVCFSEISENELAEGLCSKCKEHSNEEVLESLALYKKMIEDSIKEATSLKKDNTDRLNDIAQQIKEKESKLNSVQGNYLKKLTDLKEPLASLIQEIKEQIDKITGRYYRLIELKKIIIEKNKLTSSKEQLTSDISILHEELEEASKKNANEILVFEKWKILYEKLFKKIYSQAYNITISSEDYMPIIDGNPMNRVSSESMKLVAQLAYIVSLYKLQESLEDENVNPIGFMLFDSPKDKDLDNDKYTVFLNEIATGGGGQIFLTGSVKEKDLYENVFEKEAFFPYLTEKDKLLKNE